MGRETSPYSIDMRITIAYKDDGSISMMADEIPFDSLSEKDKSKIMRRFYFLMLQNTELLPCVSKAISEEIGIPCQSYYEDSLIEAICFDV